MFIHQLKIILESAPSPEPITIPPPKTIPQGVKRIGAVVVRAIPETKPIVILLNNII